MSPTISVRPVVIPAPERGNDLLVRVTAPTTGTNLPVVLFSHGFGFSMDAYGPVTDYWAEHGFVVISATHLDAVTLGIAPTDPRTPTIWRQRIQDLRLILDHLITALSAVPDLEARVDTTRVAVAGHSYGATTASALLGARVLAPAGDPEEDFTDSRVSAGVLLALAGLAGQDLTPVATQFFPFMNPSFDHLTPPALFVAGDADQSPMSTRGPDWWTDAYRTSPGSKALLTMLGAQHPLGGIHAYGTMPQSDADNPTTVALVQQATTAYLHATLGFAQAEWDALPDILASDPAAAGRLETK